ncbi:MAG: 50S ribosomal protein L18 [Myxococcales bacterium]|jgi:large subunit ribosomal protein L18
MTSKTKESWLKRKARIRRKVSGTPERPRLTVYKSLKHIYAQVVDDTSGRTLAYASDLDKALREELKANKAKKTEVAAKVGALIAQKCLEGSIKAVVFDRNGFPYQGRISAVADAARKAGLEF